MYVYNITVVYMGWKTYMQQNDFINHKLYSKPSPKLNITTLYTENIVFFLHMLPFVNKQVKGSFHPCYEKKTINSLTMRYLAMQIALL